MPNADEGGDCAVRGRWNDEQRALAALLLPRYSGADLSRISFCMLGFVFAEPLVIV